MIPTFELFTLGLGPSSSHTVGPMRAAHDFVTRHAGPGTDRLTVSLYGSLAATGRGHQTPEAVVLGLSGLHPERILPETGRRVLAAVRRNGSVRLAGRTVRFREDEDINWHPLTRLHGHPNALTLRAWRGGALLGEESYLSVGGGFVHRIGALDADPAEDPLPHPFRSMADLRAACAREGTTIAGVVRANELSRSGAGRLDARLRELYDAMETSIDRGLATRAVLPGGLEVARRAADLHDQLRTESPRPALVDFAVAWAMAVSEENAAGGRIVTAPTNGAAGIIPAVLRYAVRRGGTDSVVPDFLLTASGIGSVLKQTGSISGAEVGCQGEVGSACAMAAGALAAVAGGTTAQVEAAAEIGLEHHLGLACDPVAGLVQVPCIERNGIAATTAIHAAQLALRGDGRHRVTLDEAIGSLMEIGRDMSAKYKETALGGLATNASMC